MTSSEFIKLGELNVEVFRKRGRRSLKIEIQPPLEVHLKCAITTSNQVLNDFLLSRERWIHEAISRIRKNTTLESMAEDEFYFLGQKIRRAQWEKQFADLGPGNLFERTVYETSKNILKARVEHWERETKLQPEAVEYSIYRSRWGSCTSERIIKFNLRLLQAPIEVVDSIIVHELCHLLHMDHSKRFWQKVLEVYPNYKKTHSWLKKNQYQLLGAPFPWENLKKF